MRGEARASWNWKRSRCRVDGLPLADIQPNWEVTLGRRGLLAPGKLFIGYAWNGGPLHLFGDQVPLPYRSIYPCTGDVVREGVRSAPNEPLPDTGAGPRVYICHNPEA